MKYIKLFIVTLMSFIFFTSSSYAESAKPMSKAEITALLSGKSYPLSGDNNYFYFEKNGKMIAQWEGKQETTTWKASKKGKVCYKLKLFGNKECLQLLKINDQEFYQVFYGKKRKMKVTDLKSGKIF